MWAVWMLAGVFLGAPVGFFLAALCVIASRNTPG